jgi:hemerythrin superfamily protein
MHRPLKTAAEKVRGTAKVVKAAVKGLKGIFKALMQQHGEAMAIARRLEKNEDLEFRLEHWPILRAELLSHERAEMAILYPALRRVPETLAIAEHHDAEAKELEDLIASIDVTQVGDLQWGHFLGQLLGKVGHHVAEEESDIFPRAQEVLGEEEAERLEAALVAEKQRQLELV